MNIKTFRRVRVAASFLVGAIVAIAVINNSYLLATAGVISGMLLLSIARAKTKITIDEREKTIREKAAQATYAIFAPTIGIGAFLLLFFSHNDVSTFSKGEFIYLESLGTIFAYLAFFLIALYAISYYYFNRQYGGGRDEQ